jgi:dissimilatory sulfite reductase (desulfoviridin) alpha/beta subunit
MGQNMPIFDEAACIGCGCTDTNACVDHENHEACHWLRVDYGKHAGVCSACSADVARWDAGDRAPRQDNDAAPGGAS